ncbi:MAG: TlpA disulfide reductase family protein [Steroidobacteraceae bacterium]
MHTTPGSHGVRRLALAAALLVFALAGPVQAAEPFRLRTPTGASVEFTGKSQAPATVLFFWASWCPYCKALMPHLQSVLDQHGPDIQFYAINIMENADPAAFLADAGYDWTLLVNGDEVAKTYGVRGTPGLVVVDRSGATVFDLARIPASAAVQKRVSGTDSRPRAAGHLAPFWAAELRRALDPVVRQAR